MTFMFEVYYHGPRIPEREKRITALAAKYGGALDCLEEPETSDSDNVCLTFEFQDLKQAELAAEAIRAIGEYVEGPVTYAA